MSAFIVDRTDIDIIVTALCEHGLIPAEDADAIGRILWGENLNSILYRYPNDKDGDRPGPIDFRDADVDSYEFEPARPDRESGWGQGEGLQEVIDCYSYQSCEHPDWPKSVAYDLILRLNQALAGVKTRKAR